MADDSTLDFLHENPNKDALARFATEFLAGKPMVAFMPPAGCSIEFWDGVATAVIYREGAFQVQLVLVQPNVHVPPHKHPDVESYAAYVNGGIDFRLNGESPILPRFLRKTRGDLKLWGRAIRIPAGVEHEVIAGPDGGMFLGIQHWLNGEPGKVEENWQGDPMGVEHKKRLRDEK